MAPLQLWHLQNSRSFRCVWLFEELQIPYELVYAKRENNRAPAHFKAKHVMGKAPLLVLEDGNTMVIESSAICEYVLHTSATPEQKQQYMGGGSEAQAAIVRSWASWAEGTLMTHAIPVTYARWNIPEKYREEILPEYERKLADNVQNDLNYLESSLKANKSGYLVGDNLTLADIMVAFSAQFVLVRGLGAKWADDDYPTIKSWIRNLRKREGWQKATKQGEDSYMLDASTP